jgi:hypothetical protein
MTKDPWANESINTSNRRERRQSLEKNKIKFYGEEMFFYPRNMFRQTGTIYLDFFFDSWIAEYRGVHAPALLSTAQGAAATAVIYQCRPSINISNFPTMIAYPFISCYHQYW